MDTVALMVTLLVIRKKASLANFLLSLSQDHRGPMMRRPLTPCHKDKSVVNKIPSFLVTRRAAAPGDISFTPCHVHVHKDKSFVIGHNDKENALALTACDFQK
jgi:hypothetical protein